MICYFRDQYPNIPCPLDRMGSDCCEQYFGKHVQAIGNHPVYPFEQMVRNVGNMNRLSQIQCDFQAPAFARVHMKQENVWGKQFSESTDQRTTLREYPVPVDENTL